jgi:hypothetical protein
MTGVITSGRGACSGHGQHLSGVLDALEWGLDAVQVYDLAQIPEGGC